MLEGRWAIGLFILFSLGLWIVKKLQLKNLLLIFSFFFISIISSYFHLAEHQTSLSQGDRAFTVQFSDEVKIDGNRFKAVATDIVSGEKLIFVYRIHSNEEKQQLLRQQWIKKSCFVKGELLVPSGARNPNAFDYKKFLDHNGIFWVLKVSDWRVGNCHPNKLNALDTIKLWRIKGIVTLENQFSKETAPIAAALIFGTLDLLSEETISSFQKLGVIHLLSISGLHVTLLVGAIFYFGIRVGFVREKLVQFLLVILPIYAITAGATPAVNRAVLMAMLILFVNLLNRKQKFQSLDGFCLSFLFFLLLDPFIVYNIGFQLSYIVTFSLLFSVNIVARYQSLISKMVMTSYIAQLASVPFLLYYFFEIPLLSIMANLLFVPLYSYVLLPGLLLLFLVQFVSDTLFQFLSIFLSSCIENSNQLAKVLSSIPWATIVVGKPSLALFAFYCIAIVLSFYSWEKKGSFLLFLSPWILLIIQLFLPYISPKGEVTFIDVGQGDSIFIQLPFHKGNYLIDTGGRPSFVVDEWEQSKKTYDVGADSVAPFLKSRGINRLDLLILSHGDMDHIGGSFGLFENIKVKQIVMTSALSEQSPTERKLISTINQMKILAFRVQEGMSWKVGGSEFYIVAPPKNYHGEKNDGSIVVLAKIGGLNWLFTGDLGQEGETQLMEKYPNIKIDVLKIGHHGSRNSSCPKFIEWIKPKYSIISVGEKNGFGHPHSEVLLILETQGSKIYRTDQQGAITYLFRANKGTFSHTIP